MTQVPRHRERQEPVLTSALGSSTATAEGTSNDTEQRNVRGTVIQGPWLLQIPPAGSSGQQGGRTDPARLGFFAFRPGLSPPPAGMPAAYKSATMLVPDVALRFPAVRWQRPALIVISCVATLLVHLFPVGFLLQAPQGVGAGGTELEAVSIEMVDASVLDAQRETRDDGAGAAQSVAAVTGNNVAPASTAVSEAAQEPPEDAHADKFAPFPTEPTPRPLSQPVLVAQDAEVTVAAKTEVTPAPSPKFIPDATVIAPAIPSVAAAATGGSAGGAEAAAKTAASSVATAGRLAASQGDINRFVAGIRSSLARTKPSGRGRIGTALVGFAIEVDGQLEYLRIEKSSGNTALDQAALDAVRRAAPFRAPPAGMADAARRFVIPYQFQ